jgi:hypothetical protein
MSRNLRTKTIRRFKGLNCWDTEALVGPEWSLDCMNVICSGSGGLEKLRYPTIKSALNSDLTGSGNIFNFQNATGTRQMLAMFGTKFYTYSLDGYIATLQNTNTLNAGVASFVSSNNMTFIANGQRMMKWTGTAFQPWGIAQPAAPSREIGVLPGIADPLIALVGGSYNIPAWIPYRAATTYNAVYTLVNTNGETLQSPAFATVLAAGDWAGYNYPPAVSGATGWNLYIDPAGGVAYKKVNPDPIPFTPPGMYTDEFWAYGFLGDWRLCALNPSPPVLNTTGTGGIALTIGRKYRVAYYNSTSGHIGQASEPCEITGVVGVGQRVKLTITNSTDTQCDKFFLYSTMDGGSDYYLNQNPLTADGSYTFDVGLTTVIYDLTPDASLNKSIVAPLLNAPPPVAKYTCEWGGRLYVFNLSGAKQDIAYSGYERIYLGRPEESFPPNNKLRLAIGSDEIRGGGVIQAGVVAFSKSNEMFMFRGTVTDRSTDAPIEYLAELEKLPWNTGCASHFSIAKTPYGLVWLASDKTIKVFNGQGEPQTLAGGILPLLRRITPGTEEDARGLFFCFLEREWYILLCAIDGFATKNCIIIVDLEPDKEANVGAFPFQVSADAIELIEDAYGINHLIIIQDSYIKELTVLSDTTGGISLTYTSTADLIPARWRSGYFGNDTSEWMKLFRYGKLVADQLGFKVQVYLVDDVSSTFRAPDIIPFQSIINDHILIDRKSKFCSLEIQFPQENTAANVLMLSASAIPTSER